MKNLYIPDYSRKSIPSICQLSVFRLCNNPNCRFLCVFFEPYASSCFPVTCFCNNTILLAIFFVCLLGALSGRHGCGKHPLPLHFLTAINHFLRLFHFITYVLKKLLLCLHNETRIRRYRQYPYLCSNSFYLRV